MYHYFKMTIELIFSLVLSDPQGMERGCGERVSLCGKELFGEPADSKPTAEYLGISPIDFKSIATVFSLEQIDATGTIGCFQRSQDKVLH